MNPMLLFIDTFLNLELYFLYSIRSYSLLLKKDSSARISNNLLIISYVGILMNRVLRVHLSIFGRKRVKAEILCH